MFSYWLTAYHNKILPFVQAHNHFYLFTKEMFLAPLAAFSILDQGKSFSDEQVYTCLSLLLRNDEAKAEDSTQSFVNMRFFLKKYNSAERVKRCVQCNVLKLEGYINTSHYDQTRVCLSFSFTYDCLL